MRKMLPGLLLLAVASMPAPVYSFDWTTALGGVAKAVQAATLTDDQVAEAVRASVAQMDSENKIAGPDTSYGRRLNRLTAGLNEAGGTPLNFKVYVTNDINAFACPDGSVRVFTGIMDIMNDDELLGIIGHEIGHVLKHHSRKALQEQLLSDAVRDGLASASGKIGQLSRSQLGAIGETLANAKYSRKQESEADNCGYDFLVAHGKNPWGMVMAFEKLETVEQTSGQIQTPLTKMFSSHPDTAARIRAMEKRCEQDGYPRPTEEQPAVQGPTTVDPGQAVKNVVRHGKTKAKATHRRRHR